MRCPDIAASALGLFAFGCPCSVTGCEGVSGTGHQPIGDGPAYSGGSLVFARAQVTPPKIKTRISGLLSPRNARPTLLKKPFEHKRLKRPPPMRLWQAPSLHCEAFA